jgi:hypothetical protein
MLENNESSNNWSDTGEYVNIINNYLDNDSIFFAIIRINDWNLTIKNCPNLDKVLLNHKDQIITYMLLKVKEHIDFDLSINGTLLKINILKKCGINWPEFDIIQKSLAHDDKED